MLKEPSQGVPTEVTISSVLSGLGDGPIDIGELISRRELNFRLQCAEWQKDIGCLFDLRPFIRDGDFSKTTKGQPSAAISLVAPLSTDTDPESMPFRSAG